MEIKASLNYLRISPRKVRLVANLVRGMGVSRAQDQLRFLNKRSSGPVLKLLNSAIANARNNFNIEKENLYIKELRVDGGPPLRRWRPRAFGRAAPVLKRTSHIVFILEERQSGKIGQLAEKKKNKTEKPSTFQQEDKIEKIKLLNKRRAGFQAKAPRELGAYLKRKRGGIKKFFQRKSV